MPIRVIGDTAPAMIQLQHRAWRLAVPVGIALLDPGADKTARAYLFAYCATDGPPITLFDFCKSRSGENARRLLRAFRGHLVVDDYAGYKALFT